MRFLFFTANHYGAKGNLNDIVLRNFILVKAINTTKQYKLNLFLM